MRQKRSILFSIPFIMTLAACTGNGSITCENDDDCLTDQVCERQICVIAEDPECTRDSQCDNDEVCNDDRECVDEPTGCTRDSQCRSGEICRNERCVPDGDVCSRDSECDSDEVCENGDCVVDRCECSRDSNCRSGYECNSCMCEPAGDHCTRDSDCRSDEICDRNRCVDDGGGNSGGSDEFCIHANFDDRDDREVSYEVLCTNEDNGDWGRDWTQVARSYDNVTSFSFCERVNCTIKAVRTSIWMGGSREVDYDAVYNSDASGNCSRNADLAGLELEVDGRDYRMEMYEARGLGYPSCGHVAFVGSYAGDEPSRIDL